MIFNKLAVLYPKGYSLFIDTLKYLKNHQLAAPPGFTLSRISFSNSGKLATATLATV